MTPRERAVRGARVVWGAVRARSPRAESAVATAREQLRAPAARARRVADLARRVHELERDQALLAGQVAALQVPPLDEPVEADLQARLTAARLEAIALYEHRIGELERAAVRRAPRREAGR